ncbi:34745_t:CDS:2 [Gigaspora margarita]|uniref:34745_t:CDS:1 n=1 Tax=Gigaspora margarita TaxID=4874 RepID=A0ABN7UQP8_GIGMA|nr:34745_t:CDS:2 [Gigaspora margarita]
MDLKNRYAIGQGRLDQVELLSDDENSDYYSQEDHDELNKIEGRIKDLISKYESCGFLNTRQMTDSYAKLFHENLNWDEYAKSSYLTLGDFIQETWNETFKVNVCSKDNVTWVGLKVSNIPRDVYDPFLKMNVPPVSPYPTKYDEIYFDIQVWNSKYDPEEERANQMKFHQAEKVLWKIRHLIQNGTVIRTCCIELLYYSMYRETIPQITGYSTLTELFNDSIILKRKDGRNVKDAFITFKTDDQKCGHLLKKSKGAQENDGISELQRAVCSLLIGEYFGNVLY